ncbi:MAG TPA: histidine kinase [Rhodanobacteraceae bacterium]|nr:histidine kinase [Rhodanobacteraceae bacterium]
MSRSSRQFYVFQTLVWFGYGFEQFLAGIGVGRPVDYYKVCLIDIFCGIVFTLMIRAVVEATWNKALSQRLWAGGLVLVATSAAYGYTWKLVLYAMCEECKPPPSYLGYISYFFGALYLLFAWTAAYVGIKLARQLQHEKETTLKATAMAHQAQLRMLRYQLNPHFLFNTLNAISTLVLDGRRDQANGMVGALSGFLRYSLDSDPEQRVTLEQEIESVRRYLMIEQVRFGERLRVGILVTPEAASALVPSLILQPLIENAIKYAVSRREEGGRIELVARTVDGALEITLRDDGPGSADYAPKAGGGHGVGLANTRERLRVLYGDEQSFTIRTCEPRGTLVTLRLPLERLAAEDIADAPAYADR